MLRCVMTKNLIASTQNIPLKAVMRHWLAIPLILFSATSALAADELRGEEFCFPAKDVPKLVDNLSDVDADRRDVVDVSLDPKFLRKDRGAWPDAFYLKKDGAILVDMPVMTEEDGRVPNFMSSVRQYPDSDICVLDPTRADRPIYDEGLYFEMGLSPLFHNKSGRYDMAELKEGTKDGKKFYKKMIPGAVRMFMPDTDYLAVRYDDFRTSGAQIFAVIDGQERPLEPELYKDMHVISFEDLEDWDASALIVKGGAYQLQPTVSVKTMKRFGWGQEDE